MKENLTSRRNIVKVTYGDSDLVISNKLLQKLSLYEVTLESDNNLSMPNKLLKKLSLQEVT
uniref:Uncharacterized protein n=1 Tax=Arion vulgaris TaxID=1028688 RepID=A0A0B6Z9U2_9EUPU